MPRSSSRATPVPDLDLIPVPTRSPEHPHRLLPAPGERLNVLTHAVGLVAGLLGGIALVVFAALRGDAWHVVGISIFTVSMVTLYAASTLYHAAHHPVAKARLKVFDHAAIYLLIAGTYTPFMLGALRGGWGWTLLGVVWGLALVGVGFKLAFTGRFPLVSTATYVAMGWMALLAIGPLVRALDAGTLAWLVAGGVAYTAGTLFYHNERMRHAHAVWHLFVVAGTACHAIAVATLL